MWCPQRGVGQTLAAVTVVKIVVRIAATLACGRVITTIFTTT
jgi:mannose/fructose/N-acetylgalactosamine-specific phosphotransferase system component IID